jgi:hypothetical protein
MQPFLAILAQPQGLITPVKRRDWPDSKSTLPKERFVACQPWRMAAKGNLPVQIASIDVFRQER